MEEKEINKHKKRIKNAGNTTFAVGWFTAFAVVALYLLNVFSQDSFLVERFPVDLTGVVLTVMFSAVYITLGGRVKKVIDPNVGRYLKILFVMALLSAILGFLSDSSGPSFVTMLIIWYTALGEFSFKKLMKQEQFSLSVKNEKLNYKINKKGWIMFVVIGFLLLVGTLFI